MTLSAERNQVETEGMESAFLLASLAAQ